MMIINTILIYTISLELQLPSCMIIHNQCLNIELVSPIYFGNGVVCPRLSGRQVNIGTTMRVCFEISTTQDDFEGALLYKLQKYSDNQYNIGALVTENNKYDATYVYMLAAWKVVDTKSFARIVLVEHTKEFTWDEDKLKRLYDKHCGWLKEYDHTISDTWLVNDSVTLKTSFEIRVLKGNFELSISISEEKDDYAIRPLFVDLER
jgi:hypothetical protein